MFGRRDIGVACRPRVMMLTGSDVARCVMVKLFLNFVNNIIFFNVNVIFLNDKLFFKQCFFLLFQLNIQKITEN